MLKRMGCRFISTTAKNMKVVPSNLKGKKTSSQLWLTRHLNDPYVEKAKMMNYRCRSAFKLLEMNDKYKFLQAGFTVVDCGAAPGSWTQVAANEVNKGSVKGIVVAIDRLQFHPIDGAIILGNCDFTTLETQQKIKEILNENQVDVVLSDMAPVVTGIKEMDDENMINLCYSVLRFAVQNSKVDATFITKLWQCAAAKTLQSDISKFYDSVKVVKPKASRSDSAEIYLLSRNFKGLKKE